jgi:hypothetical protein
VLMPYCHGQWLARPLGHTKKYSHRHPKYYLDHRWAT